MRDLASCKALCKIKLEPQNRPNKKRNNGIKFKKMTDFLE